MEFLPIEMDDLNTVIDGQVWTFSFTVFHRIVVAGHKINILKTLVAHVGQPNYLYANYINILIR